MSYAELMGFKKNFGFYDGPQGMPCNLTIITLPGATVTITLGAETHTATANADGRASFTIGNAGSWSVVSVKDDITQVGTVQVENVVTKALALPAPLESLTWSEISAISRAGLAAQNFAIGDTKSILLSTGEEIIAEIIGFNHDDMADGSIATYGRQKAGITFLCKKLMSTPKRMSSAAVVWDRTEMRVQTLPTIKDTMPTELQGRIAKIKKSSRDGFNTTGLMQTEEDLFLLSFTETGLTPSTAYVPDGGTPYAFFTNDSSRMKTRLGNPSTWWTRSIANVSGTNSYGIINSTGGAANLAPTSQSSVAFAFCI